MCYSAQLERDRISQRTKEALALKKINGTKSGKPIGRPTNRNNTKENFIKTVELMVGGLSQYKAAFETTIPLYSLKYELKKWYNKLGTRDYKVILEHLKEENNEC
jgi:DNA invertase Pin-like site-specific DNA recombinase